MLPVSIVALVLAVFVGEQATLTHELHLVAPEEARPGTSIPVRTLLFGDLDAVSGPRAVAGEITITLGDASGPRATTHLVGGPSGCQEGLLAIPSDIDGALILHAIAVVDGESVASVDRALRVRRDADEAPSLGRPTTALQDLHPLPIELAYDNAIAPSRFEVRVVGSACVPETPCTLLVYVGEPAAAIRIVDGEPSVETSGIVALEHTVHGPEAEVVLEAMRVDLVVARRRVRLPVALATPGLEIEDDGRLRVEVLGEPPAILVDAFVEGHWARTGSIRPSDEPFALSDAIGSIPSLNSGVIRIQVRTDRFSSERAATRIFRVGDPSESSVRAELSRLGADPHPEIQGPWFEWATSPLEASVQLTPRPTSGQEADVARIERQQRTLRWAAGLGMGLGILVLVLYFLRRGVEAAMLAQGVMDATGDPVLSSAHHRRRTLLSALAIVATLLLALMGAAALIVVRGHLFT